MKQKLSLQDLSIKNKKVLMRVDFNVPLDAYGNITDDTRIQEALPSIKYILSQGGKLILMSHFGKPKGKKDLKYSLKPIAKYLSKLINQPVLSCDDCVGEEVKKSVQLMQPGDIILLENLRFHEGEENPEKDPGFAKELAGLAEVYVSDAFGASHRNHSSVVKVPRYFPEKSAVGFLMKKEIQFLNTILLNPKKPFYAIVGGSKISSKIGVIKALLKKVDAIFIGGAMAYTFLKAQGYSIGNSMSEDEYIGEAHSILEEFKRQNVEIYLPVDHLVTKNLSGGDFISSCSVSDGILEDYYGVDIGPLTIKLFADKLKNAGTVLWNGPVGIYEVKEFSHGTEAIAKILSKLEAITIVGGGDSISALKNLRLIDNISYVSTGGGALLEYIEQGTLPGIEVLTDII